MVGVGCWLNEGGRGLRGAQQHWSWWTQAVGATTWWRGNCHQHQRATLELKGWWWLQPDSWELLLIWTSKGQRRKMS